MFQVILRLQLQLQLQVPTQLVPTHQVPTQPTQPTQQVPAHLQVLVPKPLPVNQNSLFLQILQIGFNADSVTLQYCFCILISHQSIAPILTKARS